MGDSAECVLTKRNQRNQSRGYGTGDSGETQAPRRGDEQEREAFQQQGHRGVGLHGWQPRCYAFERGGVHCPASEHQNSDRDYDCR